MKNKLWFKRKTYGWGWTPVTWEGWAITALVVVIPLMIKFIAQSFELSKGSQNFFVLAIMPLVLVGLVTLCLRFGEKPRWQWGVKTTKLSHIEINVANYRESILFYDLILHPLGWERLVCRTEHTTYSDGTLKIILSPVEEKYSKVSFHRKHVGLNHLSFNAASKEIVDLFYKEVLLPKKIPTLYNDGPNGDQNYYSVYFEDPDRIKIEVVYAPNYCEKGHWPNTLANDYNPHT